MDQESSLQISQSYEGPASSQTETPSTESVGSSNNQEHLSSQDVVELEKLAKFKLDGREYTLQDLKKERLLHSDYTKKAQKLAEERRQYDSQLSEYKTWKAEEKYRVNLRADLDFIRQNPSAAAKFIEIYPESFHGELQKVLNEISGQQQSSASQQQQQNQFKSYEQLQQESRLARLESFYNEQEIAKQTTSINQTIDKMKSKYTDAIPEMAIGRVYEAFNQMLAQNPGAKLTERIWEESFKAVDSEMKNLLKNRYGNLVKKQVQANEKGKDVGQGGASVGRAPPKFKNLSEVTKFAAQQLSRKN